MEYLMLVRVPADAAPTPEEASPDSWVDTTMADRTRVVGERLQPAAEATTVRVRDGEVLLTDGPFAEVHEQVAGFDVLRVSSREEAVAVAAAHPVAGFGALELRELWPFGADDESPFAPDAAERGRYLLIMVDEPSPAPAGPTRSAGTSAEPGPRPDTWIATMGERGLDVGGARLRPPAEAVTVRRVGGEVVVTDGPFAELREQVAGVNLLAAADLDEAIEAAAAHPAAAGAIEIRALWPFE